MSFTHDDLILCSLRDHLLTHLGLHFIKKHDKMLIRRIENAASAFDFSDTKLFAEWLLNNKLTDHQLGKLASHLTIGETYFFREKKSFDFLEQIYLPGLILKRFGNARKIHIWCAGCSTGEEAYSLAIALTQTIPDIQHWKITILATDINPVLLEKAKKGIYTKWSFRASTPEFIEKYFTKPGENQWQIIPEIRKMVTFSTLNLAGDHYPSTATKTQSVDIIFCRNVLIYFSPEGNLQVTNRFYKALNTGGILVVSPVEMSSLIASDFSKIFYSGYTIYHKGTHPEIVGTDLRHEMSPPVIDSSDLGGDLIKKSGVLSFGQTIPVQEQILIQKVNILMCNPDGADLIADGLIDAENLYNKGLFEDAEKLLMGMIRQTEHYNKGLVKILARTKANLGKLNEAAQWCEIALSLDKLDADLHYLLATIMQEQGNDAAATDALKMALYIQHDFVLANFLLGNLKLKAGKIASGKKLFRNALLSLSKYDQNEILPYSDGLTAGRFREIIQTMTN
jgi:chemotaxis protein methyltransferase CheR